MERRVDAYTRSGLFLYGKKTPQQQQYDHVYLKKRNHSKANIIMMPLKAPSDLWCFRENSVVIMDDIAPSGDAMHHGII